MSAVEKSSLAALLPLDTIVVAQTEWLPTLGAEVARWRGGEKVLMPAVHTPGVAEQTSDDSGNTDAANKTANDGEAEIDTGKDEEDDDEEIATGKDVGSDTVGEENQEETHNRRAKRVEHGGR